MGHCCVFLYLQVVSEPATPPISVAIPHDNLRLLPGVLPPPGLLVLQLDGRLLQTGAGDDRRETSKPEQVDPQPCPIQQRFVLAILLL